MQPDEWSRITEKILKPLTFAAQDGFKNLSRIKSLDQTLLTMARAHAALQALEPMIHAFQSAAEADKPAHIERMMRWLQSPLPDSTSSIMPASAVRQIPIQNRRVKSAEPKAQAINHHTLTTSVSVLPGIGPKLSEALAAKEIHTLRDLLWFLPRRYEDRRHRSTAREALIGMYVTVMGTVRAVQEQSIRGSRKLFDVTLMDETGALHLKWFHQPPPYLKQQLTVGKRLICSGMIELGGHHKQILHPTILPAEDDDQLERALAIVPIYPDVPFVAPRRLHQAIEHALLRLNEASVPTYFPDAHLPSVYESLRTLHLPPAAIDERLLAEPRTAFHERLILEELYVLQIGLLRRQKLQQKAPGVAIAAPPPADWLPALFPFKLTAAQTRVISELLQDLAGPHPMHRLVQGDVGSGKTAVALAAAFAVCRAGFQAALMAPTELLAEQHFHNAQKCLEPHGFRVGFLTSSVKESEARRTLEAVRAGEIHLLVGTHSLIQSRVQFHNLALAMIDEQHRFGVMQRAQLKAKRADGLVPHIVVMTATPIPRTLSLTVYGDLDVSIIDEMPPGRTPIHTALLRDADRDLLYRKMRAQLALGRQIYVVYPLVEESEKIDLKNATDMAHALAEVFSDFKVALLHGRMSAAEKEEIMRRFAAQEAQLLVSTTVIEVGIDVPNATVMVIEHAERFGLSQLHQLRGRVGRGAHESFCLLVVPGFVGEEAYERLRMMCETHDGFKIAEADLEIRGPGDFIGTRQAGLPALGLTNLARDLDLLIRARQAASALVEQDPELQQNASLCREVERLFASAQRLIGAG